MTSTAQRVRPAQPVAPVPVSPVLPVLDVAKARAIMGRWRNPDQYASSRTIQRALGRTPTGVFDADDHRSAVIWQRDRGTNRWETPGVLSYDELAQLGAESGLFTVEAP